VEKIPETTEFSIITPQSVLRCLDRGFTPQLHPSARQFLND